MPPEVEAPPLNVPSFAKINWDLQILGRRPDGYHEVSTVLQTISLHDDLEFQTPNDGSIDLTCGEPDVPSDDSNLIVRVARLLKNRHQVNSGAHIKLRKRIPTKAGLGGASSNAAVTLLALAHLWRLDPGSVELMEIAAEIGSDVPFFLLGGSALGSGTGSTISVTTEGSPASAQHLIVIKPNAEVSTKDAYAAFSSRALTSRATDPILSSSREASNFGDSLPWHSRESLRNDFEFVIFDFEPEIRRTKEALLQAGALSALLAGSGSSVFGIFATREEQQRALKEIKLEAGWRVFPCVTLSRNEYVQAFGSWAIPFLRSFNSETAFGA